ncbi:hypothetical protein H2200_000873 [Cladophialophora chaetospira]|uniref:AB hydrolase-1 domain-containing protein n=1 Tax=Cladophialophora chaetospira TaxID=386627 RepID=A0AA38XPD0_9EURO|nr:hypothetical protein H2200_000873 [Cladophialophora chaetospira]
MLSQTLLLLCLSPLILQPCTAQLASIQNNTFNASYGQFNPSQTRNRITQANLSSSVSSDLLVALDFERTNWAGSSTHLDPFYTDLPANASSAPAGSVIKVEQYTNTSYYTLSPGLALSRCLFMTKNLNGSTVPASAYVLWPYLSRTFSNLSGIPLVAFGHGSSGATGECAPSHIRNLWYQFSAPFTLALQGYAVVAPDYAGLGVDHDFDGNFIPHQYIAATAQGNDLLYSVEAAQAAWPQLSRQFVLMGDSQGGGAAWAAAETLANSTIPGYLGAVAVSPSTSVRSALEVVLGVPTILGSGLARFALGVQSVYPAFRLTDWFTDIGIAATRLLQDVQGCGSSASVLLVPDAVKPTWNQSWYFNAYSNWTSVGNKPFAGPMLVIQGTDDPVVDLDQRFTTTVVSETCQAFPNSQLEYATFEGHSHIGALFFGQQVWLNWIAQRFEGVRVEGGCLGTRYQPELPLENYQEELEYYLEYPLYGYETA